MKAALSVKRWPAWASMAVSLAISSNTMASAPNLFGFTPESSALSRSNLADPSPAESAFSNAAAAASPGLRLRLGYGYGALHFRMDEHQAPLPDASGIHVAFQYGHAFGQFNAIGMSVGLYMPDSALATLSFKPATQPQFPLYEAVLQRTAAQAIAAFRIGPFSFGGGLGLGLSVAGEGTSFALEQDASGTRAESALDIELPYRFAAIVGARLSLRNFSAGLAFQSAMAVDTVIDNDIRIGLIDNPLQGNTQVSLMGSSGYEPARLSSAFSAHWNEYVSAHAALEVLFYGAAPPPVADVHFDIGLGTVPSQLEARFVEPRFRTTLSPRLGIEYRKPLNVSESKENIQHQIELKEWQWVLRGGYGFSPSPVPKQTGLTSYVDSSRHAVSLGGGYRLGKALGVSISVQAAAALHWLNHRKEQKPSDALPYSSYEVGGEIFYGSLGLEALWK